VSKDRVPVEERPSVLFQALRLDPFSKDIWFEWLDRFGDRDGSLAVAAEQIGIVELPERKRALIAERLAALPTSTPEECQATIANLVEYARSLGEDVEAEKARLLVTAEDLDVQRRSFRGQVYTTQEEAKSATDEWTKVELDRVAAEMSSEKLKIQREGDRLVIGYHENTYRGEREVLVNRLLKLEAKKLRPPNEVPWIITLVIAGLFLLPFGGIGLLPLVAGLAIWHVNATRRENRLCRMYPEVFESSKARSRARP
jgi:hypothetical protein